MKVKINLPNLPDYLTLEDASSKSGLSEAVLGHMVDKGEVRAYQAGREVLLSIESMKAHHKIGEICFGDSIRLLCVSDKEWESYLTVGKEYVGVKEGDAFKVRCNDKKTRLVKAKYFNVSINKE